MKEGFSWEKALACYFCSLLLSGVAESVLAL